METKFWSCNLEYSCAVYHFADFTKILTFTVNDDVQDYGFGGRDRTGRRVEGEGERGGMDIATASGEWWC